MAECFGLSLEYQFIYNSFVEAVVGSGQLHRMSKDLQTVR